MSKKRIGVMAGMVLLLAVGCCVIYGLVNHGKQDMDSAEEMETWKDSYCSLFHMSYTEDGLLYIESDEKKDLIRYCDNSSSYDGLICTDKTCKHSSSDCMAFLSNGCGVARRGDSLYFFSADKNNEGVYGLFRSDLTGGNRRKLCEMKEVDLLLDVYYHKNWVFFSQCKLDDNDGNHRVVQVCGINLETQEKQLLYELDTTQAWTQGMTLDGDVLYVAVMYSDATAEDLLEHKDDSEFERKHKQGKIIGINYETGKEVLSVEGTASNRVFSVIQGKLICSKVLDEGLYCYDLDTLQCHTISDRDDTAIYSDSDSYVYYYDYDNSDGKDACVYLQYDPKEDKWTTLGEGDIDYYALVGKQAYGETVSEDGKVGGKVHLLREDFLQGKFENESSYEEIN